MASAGSMGRAVRFGGICFLSVISPVLLVSGAEQYSYPPFVVGEGARTRGCGLPKYTRKVVSGLQMLMKDFTHIPQLTSKSQAPIWYEGSPVPDRRLATPTCPFICKYTRNYVLIQVSCVYGTSYFFVSFALRGQMISVFFSLICGE